MVCPIPYGDHNKYVTKKSRHLYDDFKVSFTSFLWWCVQRNSVSHCSQLKNILGLYCVDAAISYLRQGWCNHRCLSICLTVSNFAQKLPNGFAWNFKEMLAMGRWTNDLILVAIQITVWIQGLFSGFVTIGRYEKWYHQTAACLCSARHALAGIAIATTTLLHHRPITDSHDRRALVEVCTVHAVLLVTVALWNRADHYIFILSFVLYFFFLLFSSPNLSRHRLDVCHTSTHGVAL